MALPPVWAMMAAVGAAKAATIDADKEKRDRFLAAQTQRLSPWTHLQADPVKEADILGGALSGGATGLGMDQNIDSAASENDLRKAQADAYKAQAQKIQNSFQQPVAAPQPVIAPGWLQNYNAGRS